MQGRYPAQRTIIASTSPIAPPSRESIQAAAATPFRLSAGKGARARPPAGESVVGADHALLAKRASWTVDGWPIGASSVHASAAVPSGPAAIRAGQEKSSTAPAMTGAEK